MLKDFLLKAQVLGHPNLVVAFVQDSAMVVCLLQELHSNKSLKHLLMEPKINTSGKAIRKLSFCLLCLYSSSSNMSYMNHIVCRHYNVNYGCVQFLKELFTMGNQLKIHLKICTYFPKEAQAGTPSLPEKEGMPKDPSPDSQPPPPQCSHISSQVSPHHSQCSKKQKSDSIKRSHRKDSHSKGHNSPNTTK